MTSGERDVRNLFFVCLSVLSYNKFYVGFDIIPLVGALIACLLLGLEYGILVGVCLNVFYVLYSTSRPTIEITFEKVYTHDVMVIVPDQSLVFSAAEHVKYKILKHATINEGIRFIVVNGQFVQTIDATVAKVNIYQ